MEDKSVITLKVFNGAIFNIDGVIGGECRTIPDFDKDYMSYFELQDQLKDIGLKDDEWLYYLKPGYEPPKGLVLTMDDKQCNELLSDHDGMESCILYIVKNPMRTMLDYARLLTEDDVMTEFIDDYGGRKDDGANHEGIMEEGATVMNMADYHI